MTEGCYASSGREDGKSRLVIDTLGFLDTCWDNGLGSCGRQTYMGLPIISQVVWACIMTLIPGGVGHLINPRWLEKMS